MAIVTPFVVIMIYYANSEPADFVMQESKAWSFAGYSCGAWFACFGLFLMLMKKKYRKTFYSTETGNEWAVSFFLKGDTDAKRVKPLRLNKKKWKKIEPEMKEFVIENWEIWEEEKPKFFTEVFKARLDDDWLSAAELRRQKKVGGGQRRRSSLGDLMGGGEFSRRDSATVVPFNEGVDILGEDDEDVAAEPDVIEEVTAAGGRERNYVYDAHSYPT
jgi:hypothetical protein